MMQKNFGLIKNSIVGNILIVLSTCYSENIDLNQSYYVYLDKLEDSLQVYFEEFNNTEYERLIDSYKRLGEYIKLTKKNKIKVKKSLIIINSSHQVSLYTNNTNYNNKISNQIDLNNSKVINTKIGNFINADRTIDNIQNTNQNFNKQKILIEKKKIEKRKNIYIDSSVGENYIGE